MVLFFIRLSFILFMVFSFTCSIFSLTRNSLQVHVKGLIALSWGRCYLIKIKVGPRFSQSMFEFDLLLCCVRSVPGRSVSSSSGTDVLQGRSGQEHVSCSGAASVKNEVLSSPTSFSLAFQLRDGLFPPAQHWQQGTSLSRPRCPLVVGILRPFHATTFSSAHLINVPVTEWLFSILC